MFAGDVLGRIFTNSVSEYNLFGNVRQRSFRHFVTQVVILKQMQYKSLVKALSITDKLSNSTWQKYVSLSCFMATLRNAGLTDSQVDRSFFNVY